MITLDIPKGPQELDLGGGLKLTVRPALPAVFAAARANAASIVRRAKEGEELFEGLGVTIQDLPDMSTEAGRLGVEEQIFHQSLAQTVVIDWSGVGDKNGVPIDPSPRDIGLLFLKQWVIDAFRVKYLLPYMELQQEGNGSGASRSGTSETAPATAKAARKSTRRAPAAKKAKTAKPARTSKTS